MKNREKVLEKLRSERERLNSIEKELLEGRDLASNLFALDFDGFFCRGCEWSEEGIDCEKCAKEWLEEEENEKNDYGSHGVDDSHCSNSNGSC